MPGVTSVMHPLGTGGGAVTEPSLPPPESVIGVPVPDVPLVPDDPDVPPLEPVGFEGSPFDDAPSHAATRPIPRATQAARFMNPIHVILTRRTRTYKSR